VADFVELEGFDDGDNEFHGLFPSMIWDAGRRTTRIAAPLSERTTGIAPDAH
jgi:hypothetical protein